MKFAVSLPLDHVEPRGEFQAPAAAREIARIVDDSGVDGCYLTDHPAPSSHWLRNTVGGHDALDPFTGLAFLAAAPDRVKLLSSIVVLPYRNPFITAKAAASLQLLSGNRFILGVGVGYQKVEFDALGVAFEQRGALTDEALETIRLAWAGGPVAKKGRNFHAVENEPRPVPSPAPLIWVGGGSGKAAERAARWGDGWAPVYFPAIEDGRVRSGAGVESIAELSGKIARINDLRASLGKSGPFDVAVSRPRMPLDKTRALADQLGEEVAMFREAGVTWFNIGIPAESRAAYKDNLSWFVEEVIRRCAR